MKKRIIRSFVLTILAVLAVLSFGNVPAEAANKALQVPLSFKKESAANAYDYNTVSVSCRMDKQTKLKTNTYISGKIYVPASIFQVEGDILFIGACLELETPETYAGGLEYAYWIALQETGGKPFLRKLDKELNDLEGVSKIASVKKSGKYFVITLKKVPTAKTGFDALLNKETTVKKLIAKKQKYTILPTFTIHGDFCLKVPKTNFYFDDVKVTTTTTQKQTFSKTTAADQCLVIRNEKGLTCKVAAIK